MATQSMIPLASMANFEAILFPAASAPGPGALVDGWAGDLADELADRILRCGRIQGVSVRLRIEEEHLAAAYRDMGLEPCELKDPVGPEPLKPVEDDPTWFIARFDEEQAQDAEKQAASDRAEEYLAKIEQRERRIRRFKKALREKIADASPGHDAGSRSSSDSTREDTGRLAVVSPGRAGRSGLTRWFTRPSRADHAADLDEMALLIGRVADARVRASLRRELRRLASFIRRAVAEARCPIEPGDSPPAPVRTAGGRTDRYVPRD